MNPPPDPPAATPVLGLLGAPGSGKSFIARLFAERGCGVIDADRIARNALHLDDVKAHLHAWWGDGVFDDRGEVNRAAVGAIVFQNPDELRRLESIVHPKVHEKRQKLRNEMRRDPKILCIVEDCPLLLESGLAEQCDALVFVDAPRAIRLVRVQAHRGWDEAELTRREDKQTPLDTKRRRADYVLSNDADDAHARREVQRVLSTILSDFGSPHQLTPDR